LGVLLGRSALPLDHLVGGLLRLRDSLLDLSARLLAYLCQPGAAAIAHLARVPRALLRFLSRLDGQLLGLPRTLGRLAGALHPDLHRVPHGNRVDYGGADSVPPVTSARQQPFSVGRHLLEPRPHSLGQRHTQLLLEVLGQQRIEMGQ
jgi:hypothetical protein